MFLKRMFVATFEASLNLQDDSISGSFGKNAYAETMKTFEKQDRKRSIIYILYSLLFIFGINFLLVRIAEQFFQTDSRNFTFAISEVNYLPKGVFYIGSFFWVLFILMGKLLFQKFILPYKFHFHVAVSYLLWLSVEANLLFLTLLGKSMTNWGVLLFSFAVFGSVLLMIRSRVNSIVECLYQEPVHKTKIDEMISKLVSLVIKYGWIVILLGLGLRFIVPNITELKTDWIGYIGIIIMWYIGNLIVVGFESYLMFPYLLQGYYKWKYSEDYRKWEGKSLEEWYGKKYLKKHKELLENE